MHETMTPSGNDRPLRPGFLVGPLGWLNERLAKTLMNDRELFVTCANSIPIACMFLPWALAQIKGPKNVNLDCGHVTWHQSTFADAGIPKLADLAAIRDLLWRRQFERRPRG